MLGPLLFIAVVGLLAAASEDTPEARAPTREVLPPAPSKVEAVDADNYRAKVVAPHKGRVLVVNFWATWCVPCLKELPELKRAHAGFPKGAVDVVLVSADFGKDAEQNISRTLARLGVTYPSFLQRGGDPEDFIHRVDKEWQGDLPFTVVYDAGGQVVARLPGAQDETAFKNAMAAALLVSSEGRGSRR